VGDDGWLSDVLLIDLTGSLPVLPAVGRGVRDGRFRWLVGADGGGACRRVGGVGVSRTAPTSRPSSVDSLVNPRAKHRLVGFVG
jgi:hypothetical protein